MHDISGARGMVVVYNYAERLLSPSYQVHPTQKRGQIMTFWPLKGSGVPTVIYQFAKRANTTDQASQSRIISE